MKEENKNGQVTGKRAAFEQSAKCRGDVCLYVSVYKDAVCPV